jgi:hypothetical protein
MIPNFHGYIPPCHLDLIPGFQLSAHAWQRMCARGISPEAVRAALDFGRVARSYGVDVHALGRAECEAAGISPRDLRRFEGTHVLVASDGTITTVYRNRELSRSLRISPDRRPRLRAA